MVLFLNNWDAVHLPGRFTLSLPGWGKRNHYDFFFSSSVFPLSPKSFLQSHPPCFSADSLYASPEAGPSYSLRQQVDCCICPRALFNGIPGHCPQSCEWDASTSGRRIRKPAKKIFLEVACKSTPSHRPSSRFHYTLVGEISIVSVPGSQSSSIPRWFLS